MLDSKEMWWPSHFLENFVKNCWIQQQLLWLQLKLAAHTWATPACYRSSTLNSAASRVLPGEGFTGERTHVPEHMLHVILAEILVLLAVPFYRRAGGGASQY